MVEEYNGLDKMIQSILSMPPPEAIDSSRVD